MEQEPTWITEIKARFPPLFRSLHPYGFAVGDGWRVIVTRLCEQLDELGLPQLRITQIKEKFGDLRVYAKGGDERTAALIEEAEILAGTVCEWCGAPGAKLGGGRLLTLCPACLVELRREEEGD